MIRQQDRNKSVLQKRLMFFGGLVLIIFIIYILYLYNLQFVENIEWEGRARANTRRSEPLLAQRGLIWDRNQNEPLAVNIDSFAIQIVPAEISPLIPNELANKLDVILEIDSEEILEKLPENWEDSWNPVEIADGISYRTIVTIAENSEQYPGVHWQSKPNRWYSDIGSISHVLGYTGAITTDELQVLYNQGYVNTAKLGKTGVEKSFDQLLRGRDGQLFRTVDVRGRKLDGSENIIPPEKGLDLVLTIDRDIQTLAEKALGPRKGALVVLQPSTGEILAMVSYPSFDPNTFTASGPGNFGNLSLNTDFPFLNRAIQSVYAPASSFKLVMAAAALGEGLINPSLEINCRGSMMLGDRQFWCHKRSGHGRLNLARALELSCNIYFGTIGVEKLGIDVISRYARAFGFGSLTGIELDGEITGTVPTKSWKKELYNVAWTGGDTLNSSIGQGFLAVSPLQMANMIAGIVNKGVIYRPHILKKIVQYSDNSMSTVEEFEPEILHNIDFIDDSVFTFIQNAMRGVITQGTGIWAIYTDSVKIAGKTGTGEVGLDDRWHDWFVAYGPHRTNNPDERIVVVAIAEAADNYDWWAPKATDIVFEGVFGKRSYEEVIEKWQERRIWWVKGVRKLPKPGWPYTEALDEGG